ncbi:hypothetical protein HHK36_003606 [Tetracentron sinense]|uniref:Uncharacterized protein n=1 Tax=Tetracentron sinense TaxID=13715 RepID=A0A834ZYQ8_TETSI|nr:hypothetical protein HHK36_003606 [Tetracentron sinense]
MDGQMIIESLDSLWFFSNILSSTPSNFTYISDGETTQSHLPESPKTDQPEPRTPILQKQQIQSPDSEILFQKSSKSSDVMMKLDKMGVLETSESEQRRRRGKRSCKLSAEGRGKSNGEQEFSQVQGLSDLGFYMIEVGLGLGRMEKTCGYGRSGSPSLLKMPPFTDGMAMKEHLKSWAYAVACTVR